MPAPTLLRRGFTGSPAAPHAAPTSQHQQQLPRPSALWSFSKAAAIPAAAKLSSGAGGPPRADPTSQRAFEAPAPSASSSATAVSGTTRQLPATPAARRMGVLLSRGVEDRPQATTPAAVRGAVRAGALPYGASDRSTATTTTTTTTTMTMTTGAGGAASQNASPRPSPGFEVVEVPPDGRILLVGITGVTGRSALQGLLSMVGPDRTAHTLVALTRNPGGAAAKSLPSGVQVVAGDLEDPASLGAALQGVSAIYCHALSKDAATADPGELVRARNLATAAQSAGVRLIVYNSSGGRGCGYGISQMEQKHKVEDILAARVPTVALQATMFMEELWKRYTRPGILKGTFTWSTPGDRPVQLVAARDMGLAAGVLLTSSVAVPIADPRVVEGGSSQQQQKQPQLQPLQLRAIELAGDALSPQQMSEVFARVQGTPVRHVRAPAWPFWFLARDVYRISRFLTERGFQADVEACREQFPGMMTFEEFLRATGWADPARSYEDGISFGASASGGGGGGGGPSQAGASASTSAASAASSPSRE